jgi:PucR C-terminal helix-turn-helix domain
MPGSTPEPGESQAAQLRAAKLALARTIEVHQTLTRVGRGGPDAIARALYELTGRAVAVEDRAGNLRAWAGPDRPAPYPASSPGERSRLLSQLMTASHPLRAGPYLYAPALLGGVPAGVLVLHDPDRTAGAAEVIALEHAGTVLALEIARAETTAGTDDRPEIEKFVQQWLGRLTDYDAGRGTVLVWTLSEYLDHDGSYDETAAALSVHRNTLKYRLRRIREVSGHDLSAPDTWFHLQLATRAWRTLPGLRG